MKFETDQFHVRSPEEMYEAMPGHEEALATSVRIAELVEENYESLDLGKRQFPSFQPPGEKTPEDYLRELCEQGLRDRYGDDPAPRPRERLEHELGIIYRMGFASYFLIVWDFVRFAREAGIPNSARGSACGALVSYLLELSHVDPAQVRPAVRAVPRPEPLRGARYRHRPLQGAALRGHRVRPAEVRRGQRGADRHVRHDGGQGRAQGRRPGAEHPAGPGRPGHQARPRRSSTSRSRTRSRKSPRCGG